MNVDRYERIWMGAVSVILLGFFASQAVGALGSNRHPPSHIETIDPSTVMRDPRFATPGVRVDAAGRVHAWVVGLTFVWLPDELVVPAETPVTFHVTSVDVTHGFGIVGSNGQTMVIPGYVSQFTTEFAAGDYLIACNEYCGISHHTMTGKLRVVPRDQWTPPAPEPAGAAGSEASHEGH